MALTVSGLKRRFSFRKGNAVFELADPDPSWAADDVMNYYANIYPELTTATVQGPEIKDDTAEYEFKTTIGTKG